MRLFLPVVLVPSSSAFHIPDTLAQQSGAKSLRSLHRKQQETAARSDGLPLGRTSGFSSQSHEPAAGDPERLVQWEVL